MTVRAALVLGAGSLVVVGCGGGGGAADAACVTGQSCGVDGGSDAGTDTGAVTICLDGQPCGGGGAAATCGTVPPCGGEVVGDWTFVETCDSAASVAAIKARFAASAAQTWCPTQTIVGIAPAASGSLVFDAAGTYTLTLVAGGTMDINYPAACIAGASCADATAGFQAQIEDGTFPIPTVTSIACTGSSSCVCRATIESPRYEAGTYASLGSVVTFTLANGVETNKSYCVDGNALHIVDTVMGSTGQTVIDGDLIATKQ
jgi:hypothetical protein